MEAEEWKTCVCVSLYALCSIRSREGGGGEILIAEQMPNSVWIQKVLAFFFLLNFEINMNLSI